MDLAAHQFAHIAGDPFAQSALQLGADDLCHQIAQRLFVKELVIADDVSYLLQNVVA